MPIRFLQKKLVIKAVHKSYYQDDLNCAQTTLKILAEIFKIKLNPQIIKSAVGLNGAGGYGAECGLVEGAIMFILLV